MLNRRLFLTALVLALNPVPVNSAPIEVSIQQLLTTPSQFNGKRVSVIGYFDTTVHHGCDLRPTKNGPYDNAHLINIEVPPGSETALKRLTHNLTKVLRVRVVGTFQYRYVGPIKETPIYGDPNVRGFMTMQTGFDWMGIRDKQITKISDFRVFIK